jgi:hypothetical protein
VVAPSKYLFVQLGHPLTLQRASHTPCSGSDTAVWNVNWVASAPQSRKSLYQGCAPLAALVPLAGVRRIPGSSGPRLKRPEMRVRRLLRAPRPDHSVRPVGRHRLDPVDATPRYDPVGGLHGCLRGGRLTVD